jgi:hypothetical protein
MYLVQSADADSPQIAVSGDGVYVVYDEDSQDRLAGGSGGSGGNAVYAAFTNDRGATWTVDVAIEGGFNSNRPKVVANDDVVVVYLEHFPNGANVPAFTWSTDGGATWAPSIEVPGAGPDSDEGNSINESLPIAIDERSNIAVAIFHDNRITGSNELYTTTARISVPIGTDYCSSNPNSTGVPGVMAASGSELIELQDLRFFGSDLPNEAFGFIITSQTQDLVPNPMGSSGVLCLGGSIGRGVGGVIVNTGTTGTFEIQTFLNAFPQPTGSVPVLAGETWNFQFWHRDVDGMGGSTSNLTNALSITFE